LKAYETHTTAEKAYFYMPFSRVANNKVDADADHFDDSPLSVYDSVDL
jgi:hypothetical protein